MMSELRGLVPERPRRLEELRIAATRAWGEDLAPEVASVWRQVTAGLPEVDLGDRTALGKPALTILYVEAAAVHARWMDRHADRYGADVLKLLRQGQGISRREYSQALFLQGRVRGAVEEAMRDWDAVLVPATRIGAPAIGQEYERADLTGFTRPFNTTGHPVIVLPAPGSALPVGVQVVGRFGEEAGLVEVALALEKAWTGELC
jgi:aspartyl-tRNA(Asn)/glutamyl-tRNA(Gln) amidotransferase subunit A